MSNNNSSLAGIGRGPNRQSPGIWYSETANPLSRALNWKEPSTDAQKLREVAEGLATQDRASGSPKKKA
jgi:hypothetical protein